MCLALIQNEAGLTWTPDQLDLVRSRLSGFGLERGLASLLDLYFFLRYDPRGSAEIARLVNLLTITETSFFRAAGQWAQFEQILAEEFGAGGLVGVGGAGKVEAVAAGRAEKTRTASAEKSGGARPRVLRLWSAGCSSGEEPYSALLTLIEAGLGPEQFAIEAWDINREMIEKARLGVFPSWSLRRMPQPLVAKYFTAVADGEYRLRPSLSGAVQFRQENLLQETAAFPGELDFIFCRNVLIYFTAADVKRLVLRFHAALRPGGVLFLSPTESLHQVTAVFEVTVGKNAVCYRKARA